MYKESEQSVKHDFLSTYYRKPPYLNTKVCCNACDCAKNRKSCLINEDCETDKELCLDGCCVQQPKDALEKGKTIE
jgi:hypothetical protein